MNIVTILFGWLMATLLGALFHLWRDGGFWKLLLYLGLSWAGFWLGNWAAGAWGVKFLLVGGLNLGLALIGSMIFLFVGHWISQIGEAA
jgi:uncharacterized membrane protein YeaQ/YmgE (transglycosylase-associated protein family)